MVAMAAAKWTKGEEVKGREGGREGGREREKGIHRAGKWRREGKECRMGYGSGKEEGHMHIWKYSCQTILLSCN